MKKKILSLGVAIVLIVCTFATLSACGRKLKDREITPTIEDIWQDHTGTVYAEVGNLGDYLQDKDAAQQLEFSVNGGNWYSCSITTRLKQLPATEFTIFSISFTKKNTQKNIQT